MSVPICTASQVYNAGHNVTYELRYLDGVLDGVFYTHLRPDNSAPCSGYVNTKPAYPNGWAVQAETPLTISPSLLCLACHHHGFIQGGKWVWA